jgi:hypothetical protein
MRVGMGRGMGMRKANFRNLGSWVASKNGMREWMKKTLSSLMFQVTIFI